jgi:hypothetical protein
MLRIAVAAALAAYVIYDATSASGLTRTAETASHPLLAKSDRRTVSLAQPDCPLRQQVRFVTTARFPASAQAMSLAASLAQLERP